MRKPIVITITAVVTFTILLVGVLAIAFASADGGAKAQRTRDETKAEIACLDRNNASSSPTTEQCFDR